MQVALSLAEQMEKIDAARLLGRYMNGCTHFFLGELPAARTLLEQSHGLRSPAHRALGADVAEDPFTKMLAHLGVTLAHLGYVDQARSRLDEAFSEARRLKQVYSLAFVLAFAGAVAWIIRSTDLQRYAEELEALSIKHGFSLWSGAARAYRGRWLAMLGQAQEGLALLVQGVAAIHDAGGARSVAPLFRIGLAEAYAMLGQPGEGLKCLSEGAEMVAATERRCEEAELHRVRGDLLDATGDRSAAEQHYRQAITVAERQSARLFQLRASTSLARLWRDQGKRMEASELLGPIYDWFTEGFDAPDLKDAKALLDELS